jgi:hypothetical protein
MVGILNQTLTATQNLSILKKLLTVFELEDELLIKYSSNGESKTEPNRFSVRKKYWQQLLPLIKSHKSV